MPVEVLKGFICRSSKSTHNLALMGARFACGFAPLGLAVLTYLYTEFVCIYIHTHTCIYKHTYVCVYVYIYV